MVSKWKIILQILVMEYKLGKRSLGGSNVFEGDIDHQTFNPVEPGTCQAELAFDTELGQFLFL